MIGVGAVTIFIVEIYTTYKTRLPGRKTLNEATIESLETFQATAHSKRRAIEEEESIDNTDVQPRPVYHRGSFASVLEMMSITLAVAPSNSQSRSAIPLGGYFN